MPIGEFELIARYFRRDSARADIRLGIGDDAAVLDVRPDRPPPDRGAVLHRDLLLQEPGVARRPCLRYVGCHGHTPT